MMSLCSIERRAANWAAVSLSLASALCVAGCGVGASGGSTTKTIATGVSPAMAGKVHGGQQPIAGATVTIYVAGVNTPGTTTGYGTGATALASTMTDGNGGFTFPAGSYTCPSPTHQAYIVAAGGNPGLSGTVNNTKAVLMASLGPCPAGGNLISTVPNIFINELTTVAAVWSLQQFMGAPSSLNVDAPRIGAPNTAYSNGLSGGNALSIQSALIGMNNAFTTAQIMVNVATGSTPNNNYPYATPQVNKINLLADILAYCINSDPASSDNCSTLMTAATPSGQTQAADTVQAAWYIAQNPTNNLPALYSLTVGTPPFVVGTTGSLGITAPGSSTYKTAFNDANLELAFAPLAKGGSTAALAETYGVAIDAYGNAWFSNTGATLSASSSPSGTVAASVTEIAANGSDLVAPTSTFTLSSTGGAAPFFAALPSLTQTITSPYGVAIDLNNNAWIANLTTPSSTSNVSGFVAVMGGSNAPNAAGGGSNTGYATGYKASAVAVDGNDNVYVVGYTSTTATGPIAGRSLDKMSAIGGTGFTYYGNPAVPVNPPNETTNQAAYQIAIDTNSNVAGGIAWVPYASACTSTLGSTATDFGLIGQYSASTVTALPQSEIVSTLSGASTGAGPSNTSCGTANDSYYSIGQTVPSSMTNTWGAAVDRNNGVWISDVIATGGFNGLTYLSAPTTSTGAIPSSTTYTSGTTISSSSPTSTTGISLDVPYGLEVDGNNNVWAGLYSITGVSEASVTPGAGSNPPSISLLTPTPSESGQTYGTPFITPMAYNTRFIAIDPSGNVWLTSQSNSNLYANQGTAVTGYTNGSTVSAASAVMLVGAAGPVVTPISLRIANNRIGQKP